MLPKIVYGFVLTMALATASLLAQTGPTTAPTTRPFDWFDDPAQGTGQPKSTFATLFPRLAAVDPALREVTPRIVFNGLGSRTIPPTLRLPKMDVYGGLFTEASQRVFAASSPRNPWVLVPDERRARFEATSAAQRNASICLDIEQLPLDLRHSSEAEVDRGIRTVVQIAGWVRAQDPSVRIFLYSSIPAGDMSLGYSRHGLATTQPDGERYAWWQGQRPMIDHDYAAWQAANDRLLAGPGRAVALADAFDGVCPSLYLHEWAEDPDPSMTARALTWQNLDEARRFGKPVYPFVWPKIYETGKPVPLRVWVALLREIMIHADGAILWDDPGNGWDTPTAIRVRIATVLAAKRGELTDRQVYQAMQEGFAGYRELDELLESPTTRPATQQSK